ncbi:MAG: iron ABC transporter permease [Campylobacterales bacterium]|nr:iron ABC transporter permease [Campylobacterales bacterium]
MKFLNRYTLVSIVLTLTIVMPIMALFFYSYGGSNETLEHLQETVLNEYIFNTLIIILFVSIVSLILGVISAYLTVFYKFRFDYIFSFLLAMPFVIPTYILGYIYSDILGFFGPFHLFLKDLGVVDRNYFDVLNIKSVIFIIALGLYPYIYLIVKSSFLRNSSTLLNPALSLGKNRYQLFYQIILPLSRPAIVGSLALVIMECVNEYGVVAYYGVDTLSTAIYTSWFGLNDPKSSAFLSIIAMSIILVILMVEKFSRGRSSYKSEEGAKEVEKEELRGFKKYLAYGFLSIPVLFGFIIPLVWIVKYSFVYAVDVIDDEFLDAFINTFVASSLSAVIIVLLALFISYSVRISCKNTRYITKVAGIGYAIPGVVIGVGVLSLFGDLDNYLIGVFDLDELLLSGTIFVLVFGYTVRFLAVGLNTVESSYEKLSINVNKASRNLGKNYWQTLWQVEFPIMKKTLLFGFLLVFVDVVKELPLTLVLRPFNYETLSSKTYEFAGNTMIQESSIYALCIVLICTIPVIISNLKR